MHVSNVTNKSSPQTPSGKLLATRKNPHVIAAGLEPGMPVNYWYITVMVIYTILVLPICELFV
jgi:hypothetical protein